MVLTPESYKDLRQNLHDRTLVGTPKQREVAKDLLIYFNLFGDALDTSVIEDEIEKSIERWKKRNPGKENKKGVVIECSEVRTSIKVKELLEDIVVQIKKKDNK